MKVKELIKSLESVDQELHVYVYVDEEPLPIDFVDDTISDRVDLNVKETKQ